MVLPSQPKAAGITPTHTLIRWPASDRTSAVTLIGALAVAMTRALPR